MASDLWDNLTGDGGAASESKMQLWNLATYSPESTSQLALHNLTHSRPIRDHGKSVGYNEVVWHLFFFLGGTRPLKVIAEKV